MQHENAHASSAWGVGAKFALAYRFANLVLMGFVTIKSSRSETKKVWTCSEQCSFSCGTCSGTFWGIRLVTFEFSFLNSVICSAGLTIAFDSSYLELWINSECVLRVRAYRASLLTNLEIFFPFFERKHKHAGFFFFSRYYPPLELVWE